MKLSAVADLVRISLAWWRGSRVGVSGLICRADVEIVEHQKNNKCGFGVVDK